MDEVSWPPAVLENKEAVPKPVGPRGVVELEVGYGTEECPTEELAPPETLGDGT